MDVLNRSDVTCPPSFVEWYLFETMSLVSKPLPVVVVEVVVVVVVVWAAVVVVGSVTVLLAGLELLDVSNNKELIYYCLTSYR